MAELRPYTEEFYRDIEEGALRSAGELVPLVLQLVQPKSVVDVGCGAGAWLSVFVKYGVNDVLGVDGDWIDKKMLRIPEEQFMFFNLKQPLRLDRQFDLIVSLEVAEHLPSECAETFVDSLVRLGPVVLFSAAIPFQGGVDHINEQWPQYWMRLFQEKRYEVIDCIRKKIWENENVKWWYSQNVLLFARRDYLESNPLLKREFESTVVSQLSLIHPENYSSAIGGLSNPKNLQLEGVLPVLPRLTRKTLKKRIKGFFLKK